MKLSDPCWADTSNQELWNALCTLCVCVLTGSAWSGPQQIYTGMSCPTAEIGGIINSYHDKLHDKHVYVNSSNELICTALQSEIFSACRVTLPVSQTTGRPPRNLACPSDPATWTEEDTVKLACVSVCAFLCVCVHGAPGSWWFMQWTETNLSRYDCAATKAPEPSGTRSALEVLQTGLAHTHTHTHSTHIANGVWVRFNSICWESQIALSDSFVSPKFCQDLWTQKKRKNPRSHVRIVKSNAGITGSHQHKTHCQGRKL